MKQQIKTIGKRIGIGIVVILFLTLPLWYYHVLWEPGPSSFEMGIFTLEDKIQDIRSNFFRYLMGWWIHGLIAGGLIVGILFEIYRTKKDNDL